MHLHRYLFLLGILVTTLVFANNKKPNIVFILVDDMGYSDLGCYGGEIKTPHIDSLSAEGIRFTQMYNTAKCYPSRACVLTGVYAQQSQMDRGGDFIRNAATLGEVLRTAGYRTFASGKHHGRENLYHRGFDHYYGLRDGASNMWNPGLKRDGEPEPGRKTSRRSFCIDGKTFKPYTPEDKNFYMTDAFTNKALEWLDEKDLDTKPFLLYLSYTAPHYPLHAWPKDIAKYKGVYDKGYVAIQKARYERMVKMKLIDPKKAPLTILDESLWQNKQGMELAKEKLRMEIYAAMLDCVDQNIGKIIKKLKAQGKYENTLFMFASDNGACAEPTGARVFSKKIEDFGKIASYETVGESWATVQNTPLRQWKNYSHEGGIRSPFIMCWPGKVKRPGTINNQVAHFIDIMSTLVALTGANYPEELNGSKITPMQGINLLPVLNDETIIREKPLFWKWAKGGAIRIKNMKAVFWDEKWELFDMDKDQNEHHDIASEMPEILNGFKAKWLSWKNNVAY